MNIRTTLLALLCITPLATTPAHALSYETTAALVGVASGASCALLRSYVGEMLQQNYQTNREIIIRVMLGMMMGGVSGIGFSQSTKDYLTISASSSIFASLQIMAGDLIPSFIKYGY
jgi:hypothetical protein